jgi:hypothetical protein
MPQDREIRKTQTVLTTILAHAAREPLLRRDLWLRARDWQDKAERDQVIAGRAATGSSKAATNAKSEWLNTGVAWSQYLDRASLGPAARKQRLQAVQAQLKRPAEGPVNAAHLLEALHLEMQRQYAARLGLARSRYFRDGVKTAVPMLRTLEEELTALDEGDKKDSPALKAAVDAVLVQLRGREFAALVRSLELIQRDWTPQGNYYWLRQHVRRQIAVWEQEVPPKT